MGRKLLTDDDRLEVVRLYLMEKFSMEEVGACMGISGVAVWKVLRKLGIQKRHRPWQERRRAKALAQALAKEEAMAQESRIQARARVPAT